MPVHTGKGSRSYGTVLIDRGNPVARGSSRPVTRKFDVSHYELTGEIRYLDEAEGNEVSKIDNSHNRAGKMRAEVTTVEQIKKLGGVAGVARQYKVTYPTAHKHCQEIESREKPQENPAPVEPDLAPSEAEEASVNDCTREAVSVVLEPNLNEKELALELVTAVTTKVTTQIRAELRQSIADYFKVAWQVLNKAVYSRKIDELYAEIQKELLTDVESGVLERLNGEGVA